MRVVGWDGIGREGSSGCMLIEHDGGRWEGKEGHGRVSSISGRRAQSFPSGERGDESKLSGSPRTTIIQPSNTRSNQARGDPADCASRFTVCDAVRSRTRSCASVRPSPSVRPWTSRDEPHFRRPHSMTPTRPRLSGAGYPSIGLCGESATAETDLAQPRLVLCFSPSSDSSPLRAQQLQLARLALPYLRCSLLP